MENSEKKHVKSKFWLGFSIGLMAGLVFAVVFYFVDKSLNGPIQLLVSPPASESPATNEKPTEEETSSQYVGRTIGTSTYQSKNSHKDTTDIPVEDSILMDDEFTLDQANGTEQVYQEQCLAQRTITVRSEGETAPITTFEVEEWRELVTNKISYFRKGNILKIKGLKIQDIKIIFHKDEYYIEHNERYYSIPENEKYRPLSPTQLP